MTDLISRLRDTPNWMRESYGSWKDCVLKYDRAPFEAADEIERLRAELANVNNEFGSQTADWPDAWKRVAELKQLSNDRWRENERLQALNSSLTDKVNFYIAYNARLAEENTRMRSVLGEIEWSNDTTWQSEAARAALKEPT